MNLRDLRLVFCCYCNKITEVTNFTMEAFIWGNHSFVGISPWLIDPVLGSVVSYIMVAVYGRICSSHGDRVIEEEGVDFYNPFQRQTSSDLTSSYKAPPLKSPKMS